MSRVETSRASTSKLSRRWSRWRILLGTASMTWNNERHTVHADIWWQSRQEGIPEEAGRLLELSWWRQCPHIVEQHGRAHITVDLGQRHEQLSPLVVAEVVQLDEPALQDQVWVVNWQDEELGDVLNGALLQGLNRVVVLGQGRRDTAGDKLGLGLGKPAANLGLPEFGKLDSHGVDGVDGLVGDRTFEGSARPQNARQGVGNSSQRAGSNGAVTQNARQGAASVRRGQN